MRATARCIDALAIMLYIDCLRREHYDVKRERRALDTMVAELQLLQRYRLSLYQEAAFVGEPQKKAS